MALTNDQLTRALENLDTQAFRLSADITVTVTEGTKIRPLERKKLADRMAETILTLGAARVTLLQQHD